MIFSARHALPLHGAGDKSDSNYMKLLKLHGEDDPRTFDWLKRKTDKYQREVGHRVDTFDVAVIVISCRANGRR